MHEHIDGGGDIYGEVGMLFMKFAVIVSIEENAIRVTPAVWPINSVACIRVSRMITSAAVLSIHVTSVTLSPIHSISYMVYGMVWYSIHVLRTCIEYHSVRHKSLGNE